jgi:hypothetical protein
MMKHPKGETQRQIEHEMALARATRAVSLIRLQARQSYDRIKVIADELEKLVQEKCPHPAMNRSFHPDPSGNNDSYYECGLCGAKW